MTKDELQQYVENTTNLAALSRVVKLRNPSLYQEILDSWSFSDPYANFVEAVNYYLKMESIYCMYGHRMKFNGYHNEYTCKKNCQHSINKKHNTMMEKYGVEHAHQSDKIKEKFKDTLLKRYGSDSLYKAFNEKRTATNIKKFGHKTPLESLEIHNKTVKTYRENTGFSNPFCKFNSEEYRAEFRKKAIETYQTNNPKLYDYKLIYDTLSENSYTKASQILGLYPAHLKNVATQMNWEHLLPKKSSYEQLVEQFLVNNNQKFVINTRSIIAPYELDFYLPDLKVAIEINGLRWHSEHFANKDRYYHLQKTKLCKEKDIRLIHIFEDEFNNHQETVFSIISTVCGIPKHKVYGRKTQVKEISSSEARQFCEKYHLQKYASASIKYGAYYENKLLAVMTFKRDRDSIYELSRYCVHPEYMLIGIAQKMFSAFLAANVHSEIYTYSDNRYFTGNLYEQLGFKYVHDTLPNYWYFNDSTVRHHRLRFTKQRLVKNGGNPNLTEWEIMKDNGYDRIWDCGSKKWVYKEDI